MKVCIIGNGPSNNLYKNNEKVNEKYYDLIICCNIPRHGFKRDVVSIVDSKPLEVIKRTVELKKPVNLGQVWCHQKIYKFCNDNKLPGIWNPIYESKRRDVNIEGQIFNTDYNSGLAAADYVCENYDDLEEIHLWGFDSLFSQNYNSQMDKLVIRPERRVHLLNHVWNLFWKQVLDKYPNIIFKSHIPLGANLKEPYSSYKNFIPVHH